MDVLESSSGPSNREDKPGEECGVFGCVRMLQVAILRDIRVYYLATADNAEAARSTFFGLYVTVFNSMKTGNYAMLECGR